IDQAGDAVARVGDTAGHDRRKMLELRFDVDRDAVQRHPAPQPHPDRRDLVFAAKSLVRPPDPDADTVLPPLAADVEGGERPDDPFLETGHIDAYIRPPPLE